MKPQLFVDLPRAVLEDWMKSPVVLGRPFPLLDARLPLIRSV